MSIEFGYRADIGAVGGRLLILESFIGRMLIWLLRAAPTSVWRQLPHRWTLVNGAPAGQAIGIGTGASRAAQEPASGGRGGARRLRVRVDRFEGSVRALPLQCPEAQSRRHAPWRAGERRTYVRSSAGGRGHACAAASGRQTFPRRVWVGAWTVRVNEGTCGVCMHDGGLHMSSPGQGSLLHPWYQRGRSLGHCG